MIMAENRVLTTRIWNRLMSFGTGSGSSVPVTNHHRVWQRSQPQPDENGRLVSRLLSWLFSDALKVGFCSWRAVVAVRSTVSSSTTRRSTGTTRCTRNTWFTAAVCATPCCRDLVRRRRTVFEWRVSVSPVRMLSAAKATSATASWKRLSVSHWNRAVLVFLTTLAATVAEA